MNNRYRNVPGLRGPSRASASTLCQKCLRYECTVSAQERPYIPRPSRTQQLQNPKLAPKLLSDTPDGRALESGAADELLAKREEERGRKRDLDEPEPYPSKRARSISSLSSSSVSTISTKSSHSRRLSRKDSLDRSQRRLTPKKRQYSGSSSGDSTPSYSSSKERLRPVATTYDRNTRRKHRNISPGERGRSRDLSQDGARSGRPRSGRPRSGSMDKSQIARGRRSMTPEGAWTRHSRRRKNNTLLDHTYPPNRVNGSQGHSYTGAQPRERSLSPYSRRLALTQAMNMGR